MQDEIDANSDAPIVEENAPPALQDVAIAVSSENKNAEPDTQDLAHAAPFEHENAAPNIQEQHDASAVTATGDPIIANDADGEDDFWNVSDLNFWADSPPMSEDMDDLPSTPDSHEFSAEMREFDMVSVLYFCTIKNWNLKWIYSSQFR